MFDDVLPELKDAKIFSKLDVREAYWHARLDEPSRKLTTMITPFGRYMWKRLPFGLKVSSEIFQRKIDEVLGNLKGRVFNIADDIIVVGCGSTDAEAVDDNKLNLSATLEPCSERNIILNEEKQQAGLKEIVFHGHKTETETKVEAIHNMLALIDVEGIRRICGMAQYMSRFIPDLAGALEPIRALTRKGVRFVWSKECENAFDTLKKNLSESACLAYYDPPKKLVIQVDSSKHGLGAVLLQDGRPIEYASRTLTPSKRNWAQIEKEALGVPYGLERFDKDTYSRPITVENDHKPLASILRKPLSMAPKRLQDIMMRHNRYDVNFVLTKGSKLYLTDTLNRAHLDSNEANQDERARIMNIKTFVEIPDVQLEEIRQATALDSSLQDVIQFVMKGWPKGKL